jgi:hypothetical protein
MICRVCHKEKAKRHFRIRKQGEHFYYRHECRSCENEISKPRTQRYRTTKKGKKVHSKSFKEWYKKAKIGLPDSYFMQMFPRIGRDNIPKELIEVKRRLLILKRTIKKHEKLLRDHSAVN